MLRIDQWFSLGMLACVAVVGGSADAAPKKKPKKPVPVEAAAEEAPKTDEATDFDKKAAITAIAEVNLQKCKTTNAAKGEGHVTITFAPAGAVQSALIDKGPWIGTPVAKCMQKKFEKATVPAFKGEPVTVGKSFRFE